MADKKTPTLVLFQSCKKLQNATTFLYDIGNNCKDSRFLQVLEWSIF